MKTNIFLCIIFGIIVVTAIVWGVWYENFSGEEKKPDNDFIDSQNNDFCEDTEDDLSE